MSAQARTERVTAPSVLAMKGKQPIVALTAYGAPMAALLEESADVLIVGDSLGMVLYGLPSTLGVTLEESVRHARAVAAATRRALVVGDLPFGSYQASPEDAFRSAARLMAEGGCGAVKLEGGWEMAETVSFLVQRGVPVMGHVGLMPQRVHAHGGYRLQGKTEEARERIVFDARALEEAGAFALVLECVEAECAARLSRELAIPTIGIGSGAGCDGQVLVTEDMLGLFERVPRFVKRYADLRSVIAAAARAYAEDVRAGRSVPGPDGN